MKTATTTTKGADMSAIEMQVREFASEFPTPNVKLAIELCEAGRLTWDQVYRIFCESLQKGLKEVS